MNKNLSFKRIFHSGVSSSNPSYLNQKIILTNDISLLFAGLSLPFLVFTAIYFPPLLIYPIVFLLFGISVVILNYFGHHLLARFIVCAVYITIYTVYHAYLLPANHHFVGALYAIQIVFWMPPWLVFDLKEKKWLITYVAYYTLLTFSLPYLNNFFELSLDNFTLVKDGILATIILSIAFVAISGSVFILIYINQKTESKNEVLFNQIRIKNIELEKTNEEVKKQQEDIHLFNSRLKANEAILKKSYEKLKQSEKELSAKAKLLEEQQSEIIAQNEELQQQQEEMRTVNESLEIASNKLKSNESILKKAYEKLKESEKELKEKTEILESQQAEIITQNEELQQQQEEILSVNETLEYTLKQFKVTTERLNKSITYANNIQKTILPEPEKLDAFFDAHFSLYLPKDVVSGDFYWFNQLNEQQAIFAMVDCTGHGVPGAFMSMIGSTLLHEIINFGKITAPALILKSLDAAIRKVLKQKEGKNSDGMDMSLALFEKQHDQTINIVFGGAKNNLYFCQNGQINTVNGDRLGIGGFSERERVFNNQLLTLRKNDMVYFSSDGFIDQHDSERRRLGSATFKILLQNIATYNINEQKILLTKALQNHQQKEEQRDDISVVGIRL